MSLYGIILFIIAILEVLLGLYILFRYTKSDINVWYSIFIFSVAFWVGTNSFMYLLYKSGVDYQGEKVTWFAGVLLTTAFLMFSFVFPFKRNEIKPIYLLLFILPILFFTLIIFSGGMFLKGVEKLGGMYKVDSGPLFFIFPSFFMVYWIWSLANLFNKYHISDGIHRWQLKYLLIGVLVPVSIITVTDVFLPWLYQSYGWVGPSSSIIWLGFTSYIILKK